MQCVNLYICLRNYHLHLNIQIYIYKYTMTESVQERIEILIQKIEENLYTCPSKIPILENHIDLFEKEVDSLCRLDMDLIQSLTVDLSTRNDDTYSSKEFQSKMNDIADDATIIYLKDAEHYKVYNPEERGQHFINQINNDFRNKGPIYEVVRDAYPQKLLIVLDEDDASSSMLNSMKCHILDFLRKTPKYKNMTDNDIVVYNSDTQTKFLTVNVIVKNISERDIFIEGFKRYMKNKGNTDIATRIEVRPETDIEGARYFDLPRINGSVDSLSHLITGDHAQSLVVINNLTVNINSNNNNNNVTNTNTTTNIQTSEPKTIKNFYKHLYDTKPSWYLEDKLVSIEHIVTAYRIFFGDDSTRNTIISRQLKGGLYNTGSRINNVTKKKLVKYSVLKTLY